MMNQSLTLAIIFLSPFLGSYSAYFCINWPKQQDLLWRREAHEILDLEFKPPSYSCSFWKSDCCQKPLKIYHRLPVMGYILNQRRCPSCNNFLFKLYPALEVTHLIIAILLSLVIPNAISLILNLLILSALVTLSRIDFKTGYIPDECCLVILVCALIIQLNTHTLSSHVLAMMLAFGALFLLRYFFSMFKNQEVMGLGDVKLYSVMAAWLGPSALTSILLGASLMAILYTLVLLQFNTQMSKTTRVPFGPFLATSGIIVFFNYAQ